MSTVSPGTTSMTGGWYEYSLAMMFTSRGRLPSPARSAAWRPARSGPHPGASATATRSSEASGVARSGTVAIGARVYGPAAA